MEIGIIGTSIWQQNLPLLEALTLDREDRAERLLELKQQLGVSELTYLATCNRVELMFAHPADVNQSVILHRLIDSLLCGRQISFFPNDFYQYSGKDAISHLFRTVSSLESMVIGETQITGQFKQAYEDASQAGLTGPLLDGLANEALQVARKVKRETALGNGSISMAALAVDEVQAALRDKVYPIVALVGSGSMTEKLAKHLRKSIPDVVLLFVNRTIEKIIPIAEKHHGKSCSLSQFLTSKVEIDVIVSASAAPEPIFDKAFLNQLSPKSDMLLCIDLAVPRDFDPSLAEDKRVRLVDIPRLKTRGNGNLRQKFVEASKASKIVRNEVNRFLSNRIEVSLKPIFRDSYNESVELAKTALNNLFDQKLTDVTSDERKAVLHLVTKLIGHSSFQPVKALSNKLINNNGDLVLDEPQVRRPEAV